MMSRDELLALPPALTVETAAKVFGIGISTARDQVRRGLWPTPVVRVGRQWRVPLEPMLQLLGVTRETHPPGNSDVHLDTAQQDDDDPGRRRVGDEPAAKPT